MKRLVLSIALFAVATSSGCCWWQNRQPYAYQPAPTYAPQYAPQACAPAYAPAPICNPGCQ